MKNRSWNLTWPSLDILLESPTRCFIYGRRLSLGDSPAEGEPISGALYCCLRHNLVPVLRDSDSHLVISAQSSGLEVTHFQLPSPFYFSMIPSIKVQHFGWLKQQVNWAACLVACSGDCDHCWSTHQKSGQRNPQAVTTHGQLCAQNKTQASCVLRSLARTSQSNDAHTASTWGWCAYDVDEESQAGGRLSRVRKNKEVGRHGMVMNIITNGWRKQEAGQYEWGFLPYLISFFILLKSKVHKQLPTRFKLCLLNCVWVEGRLLQEFCFLFTRAFYTLLCGFRSTILNN